MKTIFALPLFLCLSACSSLTAPTESVSSIRITDSNVKASASNTRNVTYQVYIGRSGGNCQISGYLCGAEVTVTSNGLISAALTTNPQGKAVVQASGAITQIALRYQGFDCTFTAKEYSNLTTLSVIKCGV